MRNFRYRFDPLMRLKDYNIQCVEDEIASIEQTIQQLLKEIEDGRQAVHNLRRRLMEEVDDQHLIQAKRELDLFTQFTNREERRRFDEIAQCQNNKSLKQEQLIQLYQEKKVLERLKERRRQEWETEMRKEEGAAMDEIGTQKYIRRKEFGGVLLYFIVPLALLAGIAAMGYYMGVIDQSILHRIPLFNMPPQNTASTIQSATDAPQEEYITLEQLIGDPNTPMPVLLQNFAEQLEQTRKKHDQLEEWERRLEEKQAILDQQQSLLADLTRQASDYLQAYLSIKQQLEQSQKSELSQYEEDIASTLSSAKGKEIAQIMMNLYNPPDLMMEERRLNLEAQTLQNEEIQLRQQEQSMLQQNETAGVDEITVQDIQDKIQRNRERWEKNQDELAAVQEKIRDSQLLLLKILHRFQSRGRKDLFVALGKSNPDTAAQIIADFATTTSLELNKAGPTPTPLPSLGQIEDGTAPPDAE
ncbi:MAG: flagellar export protein FliJ [Candidatus Hinthialibacter sp.]